MCTCSRRASASALKMDICSVHSNICFHCTLRKDNTFAWNEINAKKRTIKKTIMIFFLQSKNTNLKSCTEENTWTRHPRCVSSRSDVFIYFSSHMLVQTDMCLILWTEYCVLYHMFKCLTAPEVNTKLIWTLILIDYRPDQTRKSPFQASLPTICFCWDPEQDPYPSKMLQNGVEVVIVSRFG